LSTSASGWPWKDPAQAAEDIGREPASAKVLYRTFVHAPDDDEAPDAPRREDYAAFVRTVLDDVGIRPAGALLFASSVDGPFEQVASGLRLQQWFVDLPDRDSPISKRVQRRVANAGFVIARDDFVFHAAEGINPRRHRLFDGVEFGGAFPERNGGRHGVLARVGGPLVGFVQRRRERVDLPLLRAIVERRPDWTFVLIGLDGESDAPSLAGLPNVIGLEAMPDAEVRRYVRSFDAAMFPLLAAETGDALQSAMDACFYLVEATPVVSTVSMGSRLPAGAVAEAEGADAVIAALEQAIGGLSSPRRHPSLSWWLLANSWESRVEQLLALVDRHAPKAD
jgi:hypothetical protein